VTLRGRVLAALLCALPFASRAGEARANDPRIEQEIEETLLRLLDMGALEASAPGRPIVIEREARMRYELGAIVARPRGGDGSGLEVLALTPRGQAERMGLHVGDRILEINGEDLARSEDPGKTMARALMRSRGSMHVELLRGTRRMQIEGAAEAIEVPGFRLKIDRPLPRSRLPVLEPPAAGD
jgi:C-terminal processing protease CtpA/Prc